jgi:rod shape-determining protein MreD
MIISILIVIISFLLDGILSVYQLIGIYKIFPFFTIVSLVLIYPYFNRNDKNYFKICALIGFLYDIVYTNTMFFNLILFVIVGLIVKRYYLYLNNNLINSFIINLLVLFFYLTISAIILILISYMTFEGLTLSEHLFEILLINSIYLLFSYILLKGICRKFNIRSF